MRTLGLIAREIDATWVSPKTGASKVNYAARPYLDAMYSLDTVDDRFYMDDGRSIVRYFLANAGSFRGDDARRIKEELRGML